MPLFGSDLRDWFTKQIHDFYYQRYLAYRGYTETGGSRVPADGEEDAYPSDKELSAEAVRVPAKEAPERVRESFAYYRERFSEVDIGTARVDRIPVNVMKRNLSDIADFFFIWIVQPTQSQAILSQIPIFSDARIGK